MSQQQKTLLGIVLLIAAIGGGLYYYNSNVNQIDSANADRKPVAIAAKSTKYPHPSFSTKPNVVKTISVSTTYDVPDNYKNIITVNLTLENGIIKDINHTEKAGDDISQMIYDNFSKNLNKADIVGKKMNEVSLSKVGGASLTTKAFMLSLNKLAQM